MLGKVLKRRGARKKNLERGWKYIGRTSEGTPLPDWPLDLWAFEWVKVSDEVCLHHPGDAQPIVAQCFLAVHESRRHPFATVQMEDGSHIFFVPA